MIATLVNTAAWIASGIFAFLLIRDFIKTERQQKEKSDRHGK